MHEGGFSVEPAGKGQFAFKRPDGTDIPRSPTLPERPPDGVEQLNREAGLAIDHRTGDCRWAGEPMDYHDAVSGLFQADGLLLPTRGHQEVHVRHVLWRKSNVALAMALRCSRGTLLCTCLVRAYGRQGGAGEIIQSGPVARAR